MTAGQVIIVKVARDDVPEVGCVEHDHMVQTVAADGSDQAFDEGVLPGRLRSNKDFFGSQVVSAAPETVAVTAVAIADQVTWCLLEGERFADLLGDPR